MLPLYIFANKTFNTDSVPDSMFRLLRSALKIKTSWSGWGLDHDLALWARDVAVKYPDVLLKIPIRQNVLMVTEVSHFCCICIYVQCTMTTFYSSKGKWTCCKKTKQIKRTHEKLNTIQPNMKITPEVITEIHPVGAHFKDMNQVDLKPFLWRPLNYHREQLWLKQKCVRSAADCCECGLTVMCFEKWGWGI